MRGGSFVDTNIWIYAHLRQPGDARHGVALQLVENLVNGAISSQVAAEYYNVMLRSGQGDAWIQSNLATMFDCCHVQPLNAAVLRRAWQIRNRYNFSIWDCQIVAAALEAGCHTLYTEDLQNGQTVENLQVINPLQGRNEFGA